MQRKHNHAIVATAKMLRKNMTETEKHLWYDFLRTYPIRFSRQKVLGQYIADFYCNELQVVVEIDGNSHQGDEAVNNDRRRDDHMRRLGLHIVRLDNNAVMCNPIASAQRIFSMLDVPMPESLNFMATGRERLWPQGKISL